MFTTIYLVRHGEYENPDQVLPCRSPGFPLSPLGIEQINKVSTLLMKRNIAYVYASPILRTLQSGRLIAQALQVPFALSNGLIEVYSPGLTLKPLSITKDIEAYGDTFKYPLHIQNGGETVSNIYIRMKKLIRKMCKIHQGKNVVLVSHGDPIMITYLQETGRMIDKTHSIHDYDTYIPKGGVIQLIYKEINLKSYRKLIY